MKHTSTTKRIAVGLLAAALPLDGCLWQGRQQQLDRRRWRRRADDVDPQRRQQGGARAITAIVNDYNASQSKYKVKIQAFPQDSYNQSVVAAAASKKLPCILDIDGPNVPNWAWAGYLAPLEGLDDTLSKYLPSVLGKYNDKTYSYGYYDVALVMVTRKTILDKFDIRIPTTDQPWTKDEFTAALKKIKDSGRVREPARHRDELHR